MVALSAILFGGSLAGQVSRAATLTSGAGGRQPSAECGRMASYNSITVRHGTEERALVYPRHPWAGRRVHVHEVIEKTGWATFRCSLTGVAADRRLEVPVWMFNPVAGPCWQVGAAPVASVGHLEEPTVLSGSGA